MSADQLIAHALDLFAPLGPGVTARKMFGGVGFYAGGRFFAIGDVEEGALFLKVDGETRARFEAAGGRPFTYPARDGSLMVMSYFTPPDAALEDPEEMRPWALLGLEAAGRAAARKVKPAGKPKPIRKPKPAAKAGASRTPKPAGKPRSRPKSFRSGPARSATRRR
jgi:DNA transformation protein and related proteins